MNIVVPIHVAALRVSPSTVQTGKTALYDFSALGTSPLASGSSLVPAERFLGAEIALNREPGIHLHWSVPKAYTQGIQSNVDGSLTFATLPNRWVVARFFQNLDNDTSNVALWVLEADAHAPDAASVNASPTTMPWMNDSNDLFGLTFHYIGRRMTLPWSEPATTPPPDVAYLAGGLQALLAYGETFTAYYRHSQNLFGLYDDLTDVFDPDAYPNALEEGSHFAVSYGVLGWVTPQTNDAAIVELTSAVAAYAQLPPDTRPAFPDYIQQTIESALSWTLDSYSAFTPDNAVQAQAVLSGTITGIEWKISSPGQPSYPSDLPAVSGVSTSIGNNNAEALSAYLNTVDIGVATTDPTQVTTNLEWLLNALQVGRLSNLGDGEVGVGQVDQYLHARSFGSQASGCLWSVRRLMTPGSKPTGGHTAEVALPLPLARLLSRLNASQQQYDDLSEEIFTRQKKLFCDWGYHINAIETYVVSGQQDMSQDTSGAYLLDGLMHLYPRLIAAGARGSLAVESGPSSYVPASFSLAVPSTQDQYLANCFFNQTANMSAAGVAGQLLDLYYAMAAELPSTLDALAAQCDSAAQLLASARAGGNTSASYLQQAVIALQAAQQLAGIAAASVANTTQAAGGLSSIKNAIDQDATALAAFTAIATSLPVSSTSPVPTPAGQVYTGTMDSLAAFTNTGSWQSNGAFAGMSDLIDQLTGQGHYTPHIFDTHVAGVYLATAYFWRVSGQTAQHTTPYYVQMAQNEISVATTDAQAASSALQQALAALDGSGAAAAVGQSITQIGSTLSAVVSSLTGSAPDLTSAINALASLPDLPAALAAENWTAFTASIETAWMAVLHRLPLAHQVSLISTYIAARIQGQYELGTVPAAPYWQPNDPVILLADSGGDGGLLRPVDRNGRLPLLPCRLDSEVLQPTGTMTWPQAVGNVSSLVDPQISGLGAVLQNLVEEAWLLNVQTPSSQMSGTPPYAIAWNQWSSQDDFQPLFIFWQAEYVYSQRFDVSSERLPADSLSDFTLDEYLVGYQPQDSAIDEFQKNASTPNFFSVYGVIPLSSASTANLSAQIVSYCTATFDYDPSTGQPASSAPNYAELKLFYDAYTDFETRHVLSQGLSGFNAALRQRVQELQLPVNVPNVWIAPAPDGKSMPATDFWPTQLLFNQSVAWPSSWSTEAIDFSGVAAGDSQVAFNPLRAGFLGFSGLTLVDVFGRFVNLSTNPSAIAESMRSVVAPPSSDHQIYLPPRLLQPSRLLAQWISAESPDGLGVFTEWNPHPAASPICGWLLPNHLDGSLVLYDADGTPVGSLGQVGGQLRWFVVPGEPYAAGVDNRTLMLDALASKSPNPALQAFLETFAYSVNSADAVANFEMFLSVLDQAQQFIVTKSMQQDQALAVLIGQPLVLARLSASLQLKGLPDVSLDSRTYMPWNGKSAQFEQDADGFVPYDFDNFNNAGMITRDPTGNITGLDVPVRIGAVEYEKSGQSTPYFDDGVVGFFCNDDYSTFYTPVGIDDAYQIKSTALPGSDVASVTPDGTPITITLVLDPRAAAHLTTGLLPVERMVIPPDQYSAALKKLLVTFLTAPVLQNGDGFTLPVPPETGYDWSWWQVGEDADLPIRAPQVNADAFFPNTPQTLVDGWLKLKKRS